MTAIRLVILWLLATLTFSALPLVIPGVHIYSWSAAAVAALLLGALNAATRPILFLVTGMRHPALFAFILLALNVGMMQLVGDMTSGMTIDSKAAGAMAALFVTAVMGAAHFFVDDRSAV